MVHIVDRRFEKAAGWLLLAGALSWVGMIHGYELAGDHIACTLGPPSPQR